MSKDSADLSALAQNRRAPKPAAAAVGVADPLKTISVFFPDSVRHHLKQLALDQRRTLQDVVAEALNDLLVKYGQPEIVPRGPVPRSRGKAPAPPSP
jgi:hypothetical protein